MGQQLGEGWLRNWDEDGIRIWDGHRSGSDKRLGQEQGRGWIRNHDGDRIRIWDGDE